jgi:tetratricopeptide (TPR) repeat protein
MVAGLLITGCENADKEGENPHKILSSPAYLALTDSISKFPDSPHLYAERALLLSQTNNHELATADYKKAWDLDPVEGVALEYVNNLMLVNKPREAIDFLKARIATWPNSIDMHRRLSEIYEQTGQNSRAVAQYDEILQTDSLNFEAWYNKGILLSRLKDTAGCIAALEKSYAAQPIYYNGITLAGFYATTENPKTPALCDALIAKDLTGALPDAHFVKGLYYSYTGKYDSALVLFDTCIARDWRFADAHVEKAIIYFDKKDYEGALRILRTAVTVYNTNPDTFFWMARCYEQTGNKELAILNYRRALAIDQFYEGAKEGIQRLRG